MKNQQIADLVNLCSPIQRHISAGLVSRSHYVTEDLDGVIVACVKIQRLSWYQWEISHLAVAPDYRRQGLGTRLVSRACDEIVENEGRVAQCTIHESARASQVVFGSLGFRPGVRFIGLSGKALQVWQKAV